MSIRFLTIVLAAGTAVSACRSAPIQPVRPSFPAPHAEHAFRPPADPGARRPSQVVLASMPESERTERLRVVGSPIPPYVRAAPPPPPSRTVFVERASTPVVIRDRHHFHDWRCGPGCTLGRVASWSLAGAVIGHQFHRRDRGAALGAAFALFSAPWWWRSGWCWDG
jgi:hypothetical protein